MQYACTDFGCDFGMDYQPGFDIANGGAICRASQSRPADIADGYTVAHPMARTPGIMKFYTDDAPGIKMWVPRAASPPPPPPSLGPWTACAHSVLIHRCLSRLARTACPSPQCSGPTTVLVLSLLFIGFVVLLHIWGKFQR